MVYALVNVAQEFAYVCDKNNKICVLVIVYSTHAPTL